MQLLVYSSYGHIHHCYKYTILSLITIRLHDFYEKINLTVFVGFFTGVVDTVEDRLVGGTKSIFIFMKIVTIIMLFSLFLL